jgi:hypothetical protein
MYKQTLDFLECLGLKELFSTFFFTIIANILHQGINVAGISPALVLKNRM